ncbi:MAG: S8 family serine peptidase, partial [Kiritimatiellaeota bacterium]|nr:S8 family serine peptidase [Kiritimatiellota bacterium]
MPAQTAATFAAEFLEDRTLLAALPLFQWGESLVEQFDAKQSRVDFALFATSVAYENGYGGEGQLDSLLVRRAGDMVVVDATASGDPSDLVEELAALGARITGTWRQMVSALVPLDKLDDLGSLRHLAFARSASAVTNVGLTSSQGDPSMQSDLLRSLFGLDGAGQTIGVLSDSYDALSGAAADVASGDLPGPDNPNGYTAPVSVIEDTTGTTDEGRAMLQLIHDVVPAANLAFATAWLGQASFANNIAALVTAGSTVIVDDIMYFAEPMFQDGVIAQAVDAAVAAGVPYFSAAGNQARDSYEFAYQSSGVDLGPNGTGDIPYTFIAHDFDPGPGSDIFQTVTFPPGSTALSFQWDDPFFSVSGAAGADTDMDIAFFDTAGNFLFGSFDRNIGGDPVEIVSVSNPNPFAIQAQIAIGKYSGPDPSVLKYVAFDSGFSVDEYATNSGTTYGHANATGASAVGAAFYKDTPEFGTSPPVLEPFSSAGGTSIYFDTAGNRIAPVVRQTPDIVAPDGANTTFFGAADPLGTGPYEADGFPNFFGTSAAAPHAAALASQIMQANPDITPSAVYSALETSAIDMGPPGYDRDSGWGLVNGLEALAVAGGPYPVYFDGDASDNEMLITLSPSGTDAELWLDGALVLSFPLADIATLASDGQEGDDTFTVDFLNGNPIPGGG